MKNVYSISAIASLLSGVAAERTKAYRMASITRDEKFAESLRTGRNYRKKRK